MYLASRLAAAAAERIEEAHLDVRERGEPDEKLIAARRIEVVDQQPHAHAAQRGVAQVAQQQAPGLVVVDVVVLKVQRVLRPARELDPRVERIEAVGHQPEPRELGRRNGSLCNSHKRTVRRRLHRRRMGALDLERQRPATGQEEGREQRKRSERR